jgi:hypothetical protein
MGLNVIDVSTLTVAGTSLGLDSASPTKAVAFASGARQCLIVVQDAPCYVRSDGDAATSADILLSPGDVLPMLGDNMNQALDLLRFIRKTSTSATLKIIWYNREAILTERIIRGAVRLVTEAGVALDDTASGGIKVLSVAGSALIGGINPPTVVRILHPFGKGVLTAGGVQYGTLVTGIATTYTAIEAATTIYNPTGYTLVEVELGLMGETQSSGTTNSIIYEAQGSDAGSLWDTISSIITRATSAVALADFANVLTGRVNLAVGTNFLGTGTSFQIRVVAKSGGTTDTAGGAMKNSSYIICTYRRTGG